MGRIRTLDGWRGIAILLVIVNHAATYRARPGYLHGVHIGTFATSLGGFGVDVFFVLSGYIITMRLLAEEQAAGAVDLKAFYIRRVFRILPPALAYLIVLCVAAQLTRIADFRWQDVAGALFFLRNYQTWYGNAGVYTAHFWSLAIEEHFYFLWPGLLVLIGRKRAAWAALLGALACAAWRHHDLATHASFHWRWIHPTGTDFPVRTDVRLDGLLLGSALAIAFRKDWFRRALEPLPTGFTLAAFLVALGSTKLTHHLPSLATNVLIAAMICLSVVEQRGWAHRMLNARPLVWIGEISYSLYLWQQLFLLSPSNSSPPLGRFNLAPWNVLLSFVMAAGSFYLLERPMIARGKGWLARRAQDLQGGTAGDAVFRAERRTYPRGAGSA